MREGEDRGINFLGIAPAGRDWVWDVLPEVGQVHLGGDNDGETGGVTVWAGGAGDGILFQVRQ